MACLLVILWAALATQSASAHFLVWPPPQYATSAGPPLAFAQDFAIRTSFAAVGNELAASNAISRSRLAEAVGRYTTITDSLSPLTLRATAAGSAVRSLEVIVLDEDSHLGQSTRYDYNLTVAAGTSAKVSAFSIYGAIYAMETFVQLIDADGNLRHSSISVNDAPQYQWRGLMIDAGRRFFPMPLVRNLLDTMAGNKMNVLHLHASDMCRFGVESKVFPNLTASLSGIHAGFYTQQDIKDMISYAGARGIRVVPEFDIPGHSRGFRPLKSEGVEFCTSDEGQNQIYGDPANHTFGVLKRLFKEMAELFTDEVFHIGCDETRAKGTCTVQSTFGLERQLLNYISTELGKKPAGWEEVLFDASAATPNTIVDAWSSHTPSQITSTGRSAIESAAGHFYFTGAAPGGPSGWKKCWYEIDDGVPSAQKHLLLGGEMSMWSDTYCYISQCGASGGGAPVGHELFDPSNDAEFGRSIGGMIWPRGYVGAAAFWNYNSSTDPSSPAFTQAIWRLNDQLAARGSWVCPSNCTCNQLEACGKPYLKPKPPLAGDVLALRSCGLENGARQQWQLTDEGKLQVQGTSLCAHTATPMVLQECSQISDTFQHNSSAQLVHQTSGACIDLKSDGSVGVMNCKHGQPNQLWAVDATTGSVISMSGNYQSDLGGQCLTAGPSTSFWKPTRVPLAKEVSLEGLAKAGDTIALSACALGATTQAWTLSADGKMSPPGSGLCVHIGAVKQYPATLAACSDEDKFEHSADLAQLRHLATGMCLDLSTTGAVGTWDCGAAGQPNQRWAVDKITSTIVSESNHYAGDKGGYCLTRNSQAARLAFV